LRANLSDQSFVRSHTSTVVANARIVDVLDELVFALLKARDFFSDAVVPIDPRKEDFFTRVIEYRKQNKSNEKLQYFLKIVANSTSYGTHIELNPQKTDGTTRAKLIVHSGDHVHEQLSPDTVGQPGSFYFPLIGSLITSGGRLLLAMIERCVRDAGGTYLCCDTDALTIVANKRGGIVKMPAGAPPINALSWQQVELITNRFDSLSPYNRKIVPHLLRLTDENYDKSGIQRQLFGYSIAAKRYVLYTTNCGLSFLLSSQMRQNRRPQGTRSNLPGSQ
jgi:hypothetical protein